MGAGDLAPCAPAEFEVRGQELPPPPRFNGLVNLERIIINTNTKDFNDCMCSTFKVSITSIINFLLLLINIIQLGGG